jgi:hypothetical protein
MTMEFPETCHLDTITIAAWMAEKSVMPSFLTAHTSPSMIQLSKPRAMRASYGKVWL